MLRKVPEQLEKQETYETEQSTKHEIAKKKRAEEKARLDEIQVGEAARPDCISIDAALPCSVSVWKLKEHVLQKRRRFASDSARRQKAGEWRFDNRRKRRVSRNRRGQRAEQDPARTKSLLAAATKWNANRAANQRRRPSVARTMT